MARSPLRAAAACVPAAALIALLPASAHAVSPFGVYPNCVGSAKGYETQAWWSPMAGAPIPDQPGHVHLGACLPRVGTTLSSAVEVDTLVQLHNNPSTVKRVRWSDGDKVIQDTPQTFKCAPGADHCEYIAPLTIDPAKLSYSGYRELRFTADTITLDGQRMFNTTRWCYVMANGKPNGDYCGGKKAERFGSAGWYSGVNYMNVMTNAADFDGVKSETWCFWAKFEKSNGFASIDPHFHATPPDPGLVVYSGPGNNLKRTICGDTTKLANGGHRVFLRTDAKGSNPAGMGSGVFTLPIQTDNSITRGSVTEWTGG